MPLKKTKFGICEVCRREFWTTKRASGKYCGTVCSNKDKWKSRAYPDQPKRFSKAEYERHLKRGYRLKVCVDCGVLSKNSQRCRYCKNAKTAKSGWERTVKGSVYVCPAPSCEGLFLGKRIFSPLFGNNGRRACSDECAAILKRLEIKKAKRTYRQNRRARLRRAFVESIDPVAIYERDKWTCQACSCETPKSLLGKLGENAPTVDHICPLVEGGVHEARNLQNLCRRCNSNKGGRLMADYMVEHFGWNAFHDWTLRYMDQHGSWFDGTQACWMPNGCDPHDVRAP